MKALTYQIWHGDCLELLPEIPDSSVDLILADNPYAVTSNKQDIQIPLFDHYRVTVRGKMRLLNKDQLAKLIVSDEEFSFDGTLTMGLWNQYKRILKPTGNLVLFAKGRFMADLINYDPDFFKYEMCWDKVLVTGQLNAKNMPMAQHEMILVFNYSIAKATFNPQMKQGKPLHGKGISHMDKDVKNQNYGKVRPVEDTRKGSTEKYPTSIMRFSKSHPSVALHRTEKPVELLRELIRAYSNEGDMVLDNAAGSMGVGVACWDENRNFILMEKDPVEYEKGRTRVTNHMDL